MGCCGWAQAKTLVGLCSQRSAWKRDRANSGYGFIYLYTPLHLQGHGKFAQACWRTSYCWPYCPICPEMFASYQIDPYLLIYLTAFEHGDSALSIHCALKGHEPQTGQTDLRKPVQSLSVWEYLHRPKDSLHDKGQKDPMAPTHPLRAAGISSRLSQSCSWVNWCSGAIWGNYLMNSFIEQTAEIEREREEIVRKDVWNGARCGTTADTKAESGILELQTPWKM